jgi:KDO2-lipid IV(A) lauroyltransferase
MILKRFRYALTEAFLFVLGFILTRTPRWFNRLCADAVFFCFYPLVRYLLSYKKNLIGNLAMVYGDSLTSRQIKRIADSCMRNVVRMCGDILYYGAPAHRKRLFRDITITGKEHLDKALKEGNGVIGLGAHMTSFLLLTVRLCQSDIPFVVLIKESENPVIREKLQGWRRDSKVESIDAGTEDHGVSEILKTLGDNQVVYLIADERRKRNSHMVPFFGRPAYTAVGPAVISKKTGAPIVPIFIAERDGGLVIDVMPPIEDSSTGDYDTDIWTITERANLAIEQYIRKYPDQWLWMRPRWKP